MNLYEIDSAIISCVDPETGEILDLEWLDQLQMERTRKIENILLWIKNLKSESEAIKAEEKALAERRKQDEKKAESLTQYVQNVLNGQKFQTARVGVSYRRSEAVVVDDMKKLTACNDGEYIVYKDPEPNKTAIKAALKNGDVIPGCHLEERQNMTIK